MVTISFEKQKKDERYNLYLDGEFFSGIEPDIIVKYSLKNGQEFDKDKIVNIVLESESFNAFNKALKYISKSMKTQGEMEKYLLSKGFNADVVKIAIDKLIEYKYIDDEKYIETYVQFYKNECGKQKIKQALLSKKLDEELIEKYLSYSEEENLEKICQLIKKYSKNKDLDYNEKIKIKRRLFSKGYSVEIINKAFNNLGDYDD
ncbi:MAG: RecX family transcriptional regulator [Christensenellales bacterium]